MKHIAYILTIPKIGSWNGEFTGSGNLYCILKSYTNDSGIPAKVLSKTSGYYHDFGDCWGALVTAREITAPEKAKYKRESKGFLSYDWMIEEIETFGRIKTVAENQQERALEKIIQNKGE